MKGTEEFKKTIKDYLDNRAKTDELFVKSYTKENKNIDDCVTYILNTVQKSGCNGFTDDEIFSMAVHYYDEDKIKIGGKSNAHVVINHHVELTEEEKRKAREDALKRAENEAYSALKKRQEKKRKESEDVQQLSLF